MGGCLGTWGRSLACLCHHISCIDVLLSFVLLIGVVVDIVPSTTTIKMNEAWLVRWVESCDLPSYGRVVHGRGGSREKSLPHKKILCL
jgi:hypothetical protein